MPELLINPFTKRTGALRFCGLPVRQVRLQGEDPELVVLGAPHAGHARAPRRRHPHVPQEDQLKESLHLQEPRAGIRILQVN